MLKPIVKEPSVNESERVLARIASHAFFSLWSYPSLFRSVGKGKELIDLTIYFDNTLILFSDKGEVKFQTHSPLDLAWSRWYRSAIKESKKQLYAAEKFIRHSPDKIFLNSGLKDPFPFDLSNPDLKIHLIAVTRGIAKEAKKHFDGLRFGSSGTLFNAFTLPEDRLTTLPFVVGGFEEGHTYVHVLDDSAISLLLEELCTPSDFIDYLKAKEKAIQNHGLTVSPGEEETLACYLLGDGVNGFGDIKRPVSANGHPFAIPEGQWLAYRHSVAYALRYGRKKWSWEWNQIVARFSDSIVSATVGEGEHLPLLTHAQSVKVLASENLYSSGLLAEQFHEKYQSVPASIRSSRLVSSQTVPGRLYIFLFYPWHKSYESYEEYRRERFACMVMYAFVARYKYQQVSQIVVLGAATKGTLESETVIIVNNEEPLTSNDRLLAQKYMREEKVLSDITEQRLNLPLSSKHGRNDPCPCGSNLKYKKCCYSDGYSKVSK